MQNWDLLEARARQALGELSCARAALLSACGVQWRSPAGAAYRRRLEESLGQLDAIPRELEDALAAVQQGRAHSVVDGP
ncbi:hypothetical protein [Arthrobacter sp.]|uniref:hypothetical protein n=1 Tax=Arthrobacter sp. TaxID=1667 RepID=UPI003A8F55E5